MNQMLVGVQKFNWFFNQTKTQKGAEEMKENSQPLAALYGYRGKRNKIHFIGRKGTITLCGKSIEIRKILPLCNGLNSLREIINWPGPQNLHTILV